MRAADPAMPPDRAMLDANVLLAATDEGRAEHDQALMIINDWPGRGAVLERRGWFRSHRRPAAAWAATATAAAKNFLKFTVIA